MDSSSADLAVASCMLMALIAIIVIVFLSYRIKGIGLSQKKYKEYQNWKSTTQYYNWNAYPRKPKQPEKKD